MYFDFIDETHVFSFQTGMEQSNLESPVRDHYYFTNNKSPELELSQAFASFDKRALVRGVDGNLFPVPSHPFELDYAFDQCEQRIILSAADVIAGMDLRAVLPIDDVAGLDRLTAEFFAAQPLAV
jgi:hypothetical protein